MLKEKKLAAERFRIQQTENASLRSDLSEIKQLLVVGRPQQTFMINTMAAAAPASTMPAFGPSEEPEVPEAFEDQTFEPIADLEVHPI